MKRLRFAVVIGFVMAGVSPAPSAPPPWGAAAGADTIQDRFSPPRGFQRVPVADGSFGFWLRRLPLKPGRPPVALHSGELKGNQSAHLAVVDIDVGPENLQQCADAVIRLRAEHLVAAGREDDVCFRFTSGHRSAWADWRAGRRPLVLGSHVSWVRRAAPDASYPSFRRYLTTTYRWAGSASLQKELLPVADPRRVEPGDVFIQGGFPGHAVLVADVAQNAQGRRAFLLLQSYMPAQDIHVLRNPAAPDSPWYSADEDGPLHTPEWSFPSGALKRFSETGCP